MPTQYSIVFTNNSTNPGNVCIFQQDPTMTNPNVMSLAWFTQFCYPRTSITYTWSVQYSFVWGQTGPVAPGVMFVASQNFDADLGTTNAITLTYAGAYNFVNQRAGQQPNSLFIHQDQTIPLNQAAIGIGMSGKGTFVSQAQPNLDLTFTPHPTYWIAFGTYSSGVVLDVQRMTGKAQIEFPPGVTAMAATLGQDNTWNITPVQHANRNFVLAAHPELAQRLLSSPSDTGNNQAGSGLVSARTPLWGS